MNRKELENIYQNKLTPYQKEAVNEILSGRRNREVANRLSITEAAISKRLRAAAIAFGLSNNSPRVSIIELFCRFRPDMVNIQVQKEVGYFKKEILIPEGPESINSPFYINRYSSEYLNLESECYDLICQPGALLKIKGSNKTGKTSLIKRIIYEAEQRDFKTIYLDLNSVEKSKFKCTPYFFDSFYNYIIYNLKSTIRELNISSSSKIKGENSIIELTDLFQYILEDINRPLVLIIDGVDKIFEYSDVYEDFLSILRRWHEEANSIDIWKNLRIIISHSTNDYGKLNINKSPFNVGISVELEDFNSEQVKELIRGHGLNLEFSEPLISMLGGHPYLIRLALYYIRQHNIDIHQLLDEAPTDHGIYKKHLHNLLVEIISKEDLSETFIEIISSSKPVNISRRVAQIYQLEGMGLVRRCPGGIEPRCLLYKLYFDHKL